MRYSPHSAKLLRHVLTILLCAAGSAAAQESNSSFRSPTPLRYRRDHVPRADLDQFTRGYLPMRRDEFPELVGRIERRARSSREDAAWIQSADYSALFADGQLTSGLARLNVVHTAVDSSVLILSPCQLALGAATWQGAETAEDAIMGNDLAGNLVVLVHDSGQLQFPWTLRGETNQWDETSFNVVLAPAPMNRLTVDLPQGYQLLSDRGIVSRLDSDTDDGSHVPRTARRWVIQLGGTHRFRLTVASQDAMRQRRQLVSLQQDTLYRLADDGLEVDCNVELEIQREPLEVLLFRVDPELQVTSVRLGNRDISWSLASKPDGRSRQLLVRFAEPLSGIHRTLRISAVGPLRTGEIWRLPRFHPQNTFWRQGTMALVLSDSLGLRHLVAQQARQSETSTSGAASPIATRRFELFSGAGFLEINVVRNIHKLTGIVGTTIDLEPGTMTARIVADLSCVAGRHYLLEADVPNTWTLDGIESEPANSLEDHQFVAYETGHKRLRIRLAQPLSADRPLRLSVRAHRTPTLELRANDFRPLRFNNLANATRLVAIAPDPSFRLDLSGDVGVERQDPDSLPPSLANLLQPRSGGIVFRDDQQADSMTVKVIREDPTFTAENHVLVEITANSLAESYRLVCRPESTSVNRLLVLLSEARAEPIAWSLGTDENKLLSATRLSHSKSQPVQYSQTGEVWELLLRNPQDKPFEIHGTRKTSFQSARRIGLATLPDATSQEGWLSILSLDGSTLSINTSSVKPIPNVPWQPEQYSAARARYRYDVSRNARVLIDHVQRRTAQAPLWAWHCLLRSQLLADGEITHQATYLLESVGGSELQFRLPPDSVLLNVEIDGAHVARPMHSEADHSYTVTLPANRRFPRVTVAYSSPKQDCRLFRRIAARIPDVDIPVLDQQWTLWLAPGLKPLFDQHGDQYGIRHDQPATWSRRLLGPLAAKSNEPPFQLFSPEHWASLADRRAGIHPSSAHGQRFLQLLGEEYLALKTPSSATSVTWRELFESYQQRSADAPFAPLVWVDSGRLHDHGFALEHSIDDLKTGTPTPVAAEAAKAVAGELLWHEKLVVVSHNDIVMITSPDGLARAPASIQVTHDPAMATVGAHSPLASELESLSKWPRSDIIPLRAWIAQPAVAQAPWKKNRDISRRGVAGRYWRACEMELSPDGRGSLAILRTRAVGALGWAFLLTVTGLVSWLGSYRPGYLLPAIIGAALLAMLVPSAWIPLTANVFLGAVLASLLLAVRYLATAPDKGAESPDQEDVGTNVVAAVGPSILAALLALGTQSLLADETPPRSDSDNTSQVYKVIVPVDDERKPVGDYDYLPTEFYDIIRHRAEESTASPQHWLVRRATYRAVFNWTRQRSSIALTSLTAVYQVELFRPLQRIKFPWNGDDPAVQILEARLARQPIELIWNGNRTAFFLTVPNEGMTQLEFVLLPATTDAEGVRELQFQIPPLSRSQLRIETPFDAPEIEVVSAAGEAGIVAETGERLIELGPAGSLALRWASGAERRFGSRQLDVQQLSWIKVHPKDHSNSVILDAKFRIQSSGGRIEQISLQVDPRLRLLPGAATEAIEIDESGLRNGNQAPLVVRLREPVDQDFSLHLQFWVMNTAGLGNLSLPRLEVVNARVARRWLAVSVASDLDFTAGVSETLTPMDAAEFLSAWGEAELAPNLCYRIEADDPTWRINTRSRQPRSKAEQQLDISVGPASMELVLNADIDTTNGTVFQHGLSVPRSFRVTDVLVEVGGESIPANAQHDGSGSLTLFLSQGVTGPHHVELRGELDVPAIDTDIPVPQVTLQDMIVARSVVRLFRQVHVLVSVKRAVPSELTRRAGLGRFHKTFGRLVAVFDANEDGTSGPGAAVIRVQPNQPSVRARLVTTLRRIDDTWEAIADYEARVTNAPTAVVDQFRFEIPAEWTEPFTLEPAMPCEIRPIPGQRRHLIIRPTQPATDRFQVRIRGALVLGANERGRTPNIVPLDVTRVERFFVLPTQLDQQRIDWETSGLRLVSLRDAIPNGRGDVRGQVAYAVYSRPRAVIADVQRVAGERRIGLADVHLMCHTDGACFGIVAFAIEPAGTGSCTLEVPDDCELIQATVEGVPATLVPLADRRWHLRLASEQLPQQLAVLFRTRPPTSHSSTARPVQVPWVTDFDVVRTLWTVHGPRTLMLAGDSLQQHRVSAVVQEAIRLRHTARLVESAVETVLDSPATEIKAWYTPWAVRLACSDARLARDRQLSDGQAPMSPDAVEELNRQQKIIGQRLNVSTTVEDFRRRTARYPQPSDMLRFMQRGNVVARHYAFSGAVPAMAIAQRASRLPNWWQQALGAAMVAVMGGLAWLGIRNARVVAWLCQWPYAIGVLAGLAWWLFASPSLLGWAIIAVSLWGALRLPMPTRRVRDAPADPRVETAG